MANSEKITVNKTDFDALLRRANFHTSASGHGMGNVDPNHVVISRVEHEKLLRSSKEFECLKHALFQEGISEETLNLLTAGATANDRRKDSTLSLDQWASDYKDPASAYNNFQTPSTNYGFYQGPPQQLNGSAPTFNFTSDNGHSHNRTFKARRPPNAPPGFSRQFGHRLTDSLAAEDVTFDDDESFDEGTHVNLDTFGRFNERPPRTLYFTGFSDRVTYKDVVSILKGGKILSLNLPTERSATVTFFDGAAEFLAWAKRNDIYLHTKRIEVKWADRQFHLNHHVQNKALSGATRNILVRNAKDRGLTETTIRADLEHIHNLVVVYFIFRGRDAYISTNAIHSALFARTCMMSRGTYKGCNIEFYRDECDIPLPVRPTPVKAVMRDPIQPKAAANRFDLLNIDGTDMASDEENQEPSATSSWYEDGTEAGVALV